MATKREHDYQTEEDLRTLIEERAIHKDPKRFKAAQRLARKKLADMKKVAARPAPR